MPQNLKNLKPTLSQVMFWCCSGTSHGPRNCCPVSMSPCGVNKPQWVNAVMLPADWKRLKPINSFWKPVTHCGYTVKVTYQSSKLMPMSTANKHQYQPQRFVLYLQPTCSTTRYIRYGIFIHTRPESGVQKKNMQSTAQTRLVSQKIPWACCE